jgi:cell division protein FtsW
MNNLAQRSFSQMRIPTFDAWLVGITLLLVVLGLVMVTSSSMEVADKNFHQPFYYMKRHALYALLGIVAAGIAYSIPLSFWQNRSGTLLIISFILLVLVLVPHIGREVNGSKRWIGLGPINVQVSEISKLCTVIYLAGYLVRRRDEVRQQWSGFIKPMMVMALMMVLLLMEPDFGAVVVTMGAVIGVMFLSGMRVMQFLVLIGSSILALGFLAVAQPYRMKRLVAFLDPWADSLGSGYQLTQSLIAFGRGEWWGLGLGNSIQKLFYLPEAHTDFLFAVIAEELGLIGALFVLILLVCLVLRAIRIGKHAEQKGQDFAAYMAYGVALLFCGQFMINIGVNIGLMPTKGLTLPFLSYGGSSLVICCFIVGLLLRIDYESRVKLVMGGART